MEFCPSQGWCPGDLLQTSSRGGREDQSRGRYGALTEGCHNCPFEDSTRGFEGVSAEAQRAPAGGRPSSTRSPLVASSSRLGLMANLPSGHEMVHLRSARKEKRSMGAAFRAVASVQCEIFCRSEPNHGAMRPQRQGQYYCHQSATGEKLCSHARALATS